MKGIKKFFVPCVRKRPIISENDTGRPIVSSYQDTPINGYKGRQNDIPVYVGGKYTITSQYNFLCDDFNLQMGDFIYYDGGMYEVISDPKNTNHKNNHIKVMLQKTDQVKQL